MTLRAPEDKKSKLIGAILSIPVPGLGQIYQRKIKRGAGIFLAVITILLTVVWYGHPAWYIPIILLWLWNIWDAWSQPRGKSVVPAVVLWLIIAYGIGWQVTGMNPLALFENPTRANNILSQMLKPTMFEKRSNTVEGYVKVQVPCSTNPPKAERTQNNIHIVVTPDCANINDIISISADGLWPDMPVYLTWQDPISAVSIRETLQADKQGKLQTKLEVVPAVQRVVADPTKPLLHEIHLKQEKLTGGIKLSDVGKYILQGIYETLMMALLSTTIGALLAVPISFLAARNLMSTNKISLGIYYIVRTILNIFRSIEALIIAIIFVVIVGLGPFAGMIAITIHTVAALGKLYSELIEGIDPGPVEAIRATGANWLNTIRYGVLPQIVPPFAALTIYRWDINIRTSTIIGLVGGGGIGFWLWQFILIADYRAVSTCFIAIAVVVILMDFFSAQLRQRLV
ncbi:MAG: phosphonate ABC transporter, permease protein PhnE [Anaerolineaceae bacterium]